MRPNHTEMKYMHELSKMTFDWGSAGQRPTGGRQFCNQLSLWSECANSQSQELRHKTVRIIKWRESYFKK